MLPAWKMLYTQSNSLTIDLWEEDRDRHERDWPNFVTRRKRIFDIFKKKLKILKFSYLEPEG
jgi:hypothetical protein